MDAARKLHALRCGEGGDEAAAKAALAECRRLEEALGLEKLKRGRF
jgi:hypothetical protein